MVLYPTGITGEMLQMFAAYKFLTPAFSRWVITTFVIYFPMGPFMVNNMWVTRQRSYKKRNAALLPPRPESGLVWPITDAATKTRGSTETNRAILSKSIFVLDSKAGASAESEKNWRFKYVKHLLTQVQVCVKSVDRRYTAYIRLSYINNAPV